MSYAEQYFGVKQNQILQYADNLAFFGKDSYVYKNEKMMLEIINNELALTNTVAAFYCYIWAKENGYVVSDLFKVGLKISIYNQDYETTYDFVLYKFNEDGSADFVNSEVMFASPMSTATDGLEILNLENYDIVQFLNGGENWRNDWAKTTDIPATVDKNTGNYVLQNYKHLKGFLNGIEEEAKENLKSFKDDKNIYFTPISAEDAIEIIDNTDATLHKVSKQALKFHEKYISKYAPLGTNFVVGSPIWTSLIEDVTAEAIANKPLLRGNIVLSTLAVNTVEANQSNTVTNPLITTVGLVNVKCRL